ncbi:MAG: SigB/SigF/SigG family RNA polymerase sigma factor [Clostridia bacterium]|nr:SigB/SigF/SigG family RNA polymerase sigma factor [Clostridia bacterium]
MQEDYANNNLDVIEAQKGNQEAMQKLIDRNKGLIWSIVKRFQDRGYELEDLYQVAVMGFIKCIKRFDSSFEVQLTTYAVPYILGEVKRYLRDDGPVKISRSIKELAMKAIEAQNEYFRKTGKEIKIEELSEMLHTAKEELALAMEAFRPVESIYQPAYEGDEEGICLLDKMESGNNQEEMIANSICIQEALKNLKDQEKQIIVLRYYKGKTQTEVAKILGITQVQVSRIEKKSLERMRTKLAV